MEIESKLLLANRKQVKDIDAGLPFLYSGNLMMKCRLGGLVAEKIVNVSHGDTFCVNLNTGCIIMVHGDVEVIPKSAMVKVK